MEAQIEANAIAFLAKGDYWQPIGREVPVFVNGEGPFLFRADRLMPISYRAAWALLRLGNTLPDGQPVSFPTYSSGWVTDEGVKSVSNHLHTT